MTAPQGLEIGEKVLFDPELLFRIFNCRRNPSVLAPRMDHVKSLPGTPKHISVLLMLQ